MSKQTVKAFSNYRDFDALGLAELVKRGETTPAELVVAAIEQIESLDPSLNAIIHKAYDYAMELAVGPVPDGPFCGVPTMVKDLGVAWEGMPMTRACPYFKDVVSRHDSETITRLKRAGFILVGQTNLAENGWALSTESALFGVTINPWREDIVSGGSSGGSAVAVSAGMVPLAEASDAAGSIRIPASNNGIVGLKPSKGRMTFAPEAADFYYGGAQILSVSRTVRDSAAFLDVVCGSVPGDPYNTPPPTRPYLEEMNSERRGLRIGYTVSTPDGGPVHEEAVASVEYTAKLCETLGHTVEPFDMVFDFESAWQNYTRIIAVQHARSFGEAAKTVGREVTADDVCPTIWGSIQRGRSVGGVSHAGDVEQMRLFSRQIASAIAEFDVFLTPVMPQPPRPVGYWDMREPDIDVYNANMAPDCTFTVPFNISGQPAMSLPLHMTADGLPMGVQLVGRPADEATVFQLAGQLEIAAPWIDRNPPNYS